MELTCCPGCGRSLPNNPTNDKLSLRQHLALQLAAQGYDHTEIAHRMGISPHTVKDHLQEARIKLGADSTWRAVAYAYRKGILT